MPSEYTCWIELVVTPYLLHLLLSLELMEMQLSLDSATINFTPIGDISEHPPTIGA